MKGTVRGNMTGEVLLDQMQRTGLVPVFNHSDGEVAKNVLDASYKGGVRVFEFTNRGENALEVFGLLAEYAKRYDDLRLGIGTIFNVKDAEKFLEKGAKFVVSPALIPEIAHFADQNGLLWVPGCGTVTEIHQALQLGANLIKIFPGNVLGPGFVKSVKAVFPHIPIMPTGGVKPTQENLEAWFNAGVHCVGMGSQLFNKESLVRKDFGAIAKSVSEALDRIKKIRG